MPLMHCVHTSTLRKEMFLVIVQKQQQYVTGHTSFWAMSSKTSDRLLKRPDYHMLWAGETVSPADGRQRNEDVFQRQLSRLERNTHLDTGEQNRTDIGVWLHRVVLDTFGYVKPVELSMHQLPQTAVELPCTTDYTSCWVQHSLQLVVDDLWSPSEGNVTVVDAGRHKGVHERRGRLRKSVSAGCGKA